MLVPLPPPDHDPAQARDAADEILSRPEYQWRGSGDNVFDRIAEWIADRLGDIASPLGVGGGNLPVWVGWLVIGLLVAATGVLIYRSRAGWRPGPGSRGEGGRVVVGDDDESVDWPAEVARCEAAGRWREAVRARYRVLVGELAGRRMIGDLAGRTAGELVDEVTATAPAVAPGFARATELFEVAWYGGGAVGHADRDRFVEAAAAVVAAAERVGTRPAVPA